MTRQRSPRASSVAVRKRQGLYIVDVSFNAPEGRKRTRQKYETKTAADAQAKAIRQRLDAGLPPFVTERETRPAQTVLQVLEAYPKTVRGDQHVKAIKATALAGKSAEDFGLEALEGFIVERAKVGASPKTCAKDFSFLKRACKYAKAHDLISRHYFEKLDGDKTTRRRLMPAYSVNESAGKEIPDSDLEAILEHLAKDARRAVFFARTTGCRKREVCSLDWREHWTVSGFKPITQKGSSERLVPYNPAILGPRRPGGLVFAELGSTSEAIYQRLTAAWRYAVKKASVRPYRFHDLRHTYGTVLRREGKTFSDIAAIMGITEAMAHVYAHEDREAIQIAAFQLGTNSALLRLAKLSS